MEINDLHMIEANGWNAGFEYGFRKGYNKAIDDFADKIISLCDDGEFIARLNEFTATTILEISEHLKVVK